MKANVTISRDSNDRYNIEIHDTASGFGIVRVSMSGSDFAAAVTGKAMMPAEIQRIAEDRDYAVIGKTRQVENVFCEKQEIMRGPSQREIVEADFEARFGDSDWRLLNDGTSSQQPGKKHRYSIARFIDSGEIE